MNKIALFNLIISPYLVERINKLNELTQKKNSEFNFIALVGNKKIKSRKGWDYFEKLNSKKKIIKSLLFNRRVIFKDLNYSIDYNIFFPIGLISETLKNKYSYIEVCSSAEIIAVIPAKLLNKTKIILKVEDTLHSTRNHNFIRKLSKRFLYSLADKYMAYSIDSIEFLLDFGIKEELITRTRWSIDIPKLKVRNLVIKNFIYVGSLYPGKGLDILIDSWTSYKIKKNSDCILNIVGDGPMLSELQSMSKNTNGIIFHGNIDNLKVLKMYEKSFCFILPTKQDLFSLTVLESLSRGCPVLTTNYNGARELIKESNGLIFDLTVESLTNNLLIVNEKSYSRSEVQKSVIAHENGTVVNAMFNFYNNLK